MLRQFLSSFIYLQNVLASPYFIGLFLLSPAQCNLLLSQQERLRFGIYQKKNRPVWYNVSCQATAIR